MGLASNNSIQTLLLQNFDWGDPLHNYIFITTKPLLSELYIIC